jgi:hypothetical protein
MPAVPIADQTAAVIPAMATTPTTLETKLVATVRVTTALATTLLTASTMFVLETMDPTVMLMAAQTIVLAIIVHTTIQGMQTTDTLTIPQLDMLVHTITVRPATQATFVYSSQHLTS